MCGFFKVSKETFFEGSGLIGCEPLLSTTLMLPSTSGPRREGFAGVIFSILREGMSLYQVFVQVFVKTWQRSEND